MNNDTRTDSVSIIFKKNYVDIQNSIPLRLKTTESWMLFRALTRWQYCHLKYGGRYLWMKTKRIKERTLLSMSLS